MKLPKGFYTPKIPGWICRWRGQGQTITAPPWTSLTPQSNGAGRCMVSYTSPRDYTHKLLVKGIEEPY